LVKKRGAKPTTKGGDVWQLGVGKDEQKNVVVISPRSHGCSVR